MLNLFANFNINLSNTMLIEPGLCHFLILSFILFTFGIFIMVSGGNLLKILTGLIFMLNSVVLNFATVNSFINPDNSLLNINQNSQNSLASTFAPIDSIVFDFSMPAGQIFAIFVAIIGTLEIIVGLSVIIYIFLKNKNLDTGKLSFLKSDESTKEGDFNE